MRLRRWRQEHGLDAQELAYELGISPSWISKIERGRGRPKPSLARRIATALGKPYIEVWRAVNEDYVGVGDGAGVDREADNPETHRKAIVASGRRSGSGPDGLAVGEQETKRAT